MKTATTIEEQIELLDSRGMKFAGSHTNRHIRQRIIVTTSFKKVPLLRMWLHSIILTTILGISLLHICIE